MGTARETLRRPQDERTARRRPPLVVGAADDAAEMDADHAAEQAIARLATSGTAAGPSDAPAPAPHPTARSLARRLHVDAPDVVRRKLAPDAFSSKALKDQGLKGGYRTVGKSKFGRLMALLDDYQASAGVPQELESLGRIVQACDTWTNSGYRSKDHSDAKQQEEDSKSAEVDRIRKAALDEQDRILSSMSDSVALGLPPAQQAQGIARSLAKYLGTTCEALVALDDEAFVDLYVEDVYIESVKAKKGAKGARQEAKTLSDLVFTSKNYDFKDLEDGTVKDLVAKIRATKVDQNSELTQRAAPALAGTRENHYRPRGMAKGSGIAITGNDAMVDGTKAALRAISSTPIGRTLFAELSRHGMTEEKAVDGKGHQGAKPRQIVARIWPSSLATAADLNSKGQLTYNIAAGPGGVGFDPNSDRVGTEAQASKEAWRKRDACVALFHELIHVLLAMRKDTSPERWDKSGILDGEGADGSISMSDQGDMAECRIVGVNFKARITGKDGKERDVELPFSDAKKNPMTENQFRLQLAQVKFDQGDGAPDKAYLRPGYSDQVKAQVKLSEDERVVPLT